MIHLHGIQAVAFRVLIVDPDSVQGNILARCVEMLGWSAESALTADQAAARFGVRPHDVVVIGDLNPRDSTGLLHHLRADHADPVVILIAGSNKAARAEMARTARVVGLRVAGTLTRPIDPYRLHALLLANPVRAPDERRLNLPQPHADDLDRALREGEIHTEYQPKTDLLTGEIVGGEALARWRSPTFGLIPPAQFVALAEQSNLINRLTFHVLREAVVACRSWREVQPNCSVAVNLSPHVLADPALLPTIDALLTEHKIPASALTAEVTETTLLSNLPSATEVLTRLSLRGVRVSIDDFGTGYSSVLSLLRMPFTELKIDRSFVSVCRTDPEAWKLVRATVSLARELGLQVVAEGIETEAISDRLRDAGCDTGQGWYFGRPMQQAAMLRWLTPLISFGRDPNAVPPRPQGPNPVAETPPSPASAQTLFALQS